MRPRPSAKPHPGWEIPRRSPPSTARTGPWPSTAGGPCVRPASSPLSALSYLKTAWRKMKRQKGYALINVAGLAVGLAGALFIWLWVQDELSFDRFHATRPPSSGSSRTRSGGQGKFHVYVTQYPMGPAIQAAIPEIKSTVRQSGTGGLLIR